MAIPLYLAMTAAEFSRCPALPPHPAWMSCRFSPGGSGLSNLPPSLPAGTLLILDDRTPPDKHEIDILRQQLSGIIDANRCCGLLLDFQRPGDRLTGQIAVELLSLPCPVCVSHIYSRDLSCPVFLPPCPLTVPLSVHLAPWDGREIWLEAALNCNRYRITEAGCQYVPFDGNGSYPHYDSSLHCRYRTEILPGAIQVSLRRTPDDLSRLMKEAEALGVTQAVGLWQELA